MLFRVVGTDAYVWGSIHLLRPSEQELSPQLWAVVEGTKCFVFEHDISNPQIPAFAWYQDGDLLENHISASTFAVAKQVWEELNLTAPLQQFKPWWAALVMSTTRLVAFGFRPELGVGKQILPRMPTNNIVYLETGNDAFSQFDNSPLVEQESMLYRFAMFEELRERFLQMFAAWLSGDLVGLEEYQKFGESKEPLLHRGLITGRNLTWAPSIRQHIESRVPTLITVGALHLPGPLGILQQIRDLGYELLAI